MTDPNLGERVAALTVQVQHLADGLQRNTEAIAAVNAGLAERDAGAMQERRQDRRALWGIAGSLMVALIGLVAVCLAAGVFG